MQSSGVSLRISKVWPEAEGVTGVELASPDGGLLPAFSPGAHIVLNLPNGIARQYSLCNDPAERDRYRLAVLRTADSRGGSAYVAERLRPGDLIEVGGPRNNFALTTEQPHTLLIAGGIGITPLFCMMHELHRLRRPYRLILCARSPAHAAFQPALSAPPFAPHVELVFDGGDPSRGIDLRKRLADVAPGTVVYCCGPDRFMAAVREAGAHLPAGSLRFESFAPPAGKPPVTTEAGAFEVELARSGRVIEVPAGKSILTVLREGGFRADSLCEEGYCGTCVVPLLAGEADHRDSVLSDAERQDNKAIAICCSRALSRRLTIDL